MAALVALAVALGLLLATAAGASAQASGRPNVVVVMTDDQDARSLRVMKKVKRKIGGAGATFKNFFATYPLCCPSRVTFLTGQYAHNHGVMSNSPPDGGYTAYDDTRSLPIALQQSGYRTAYVGKYLNRYGNTQETARTVPMGWDRWYVPVNKTAFRMYDYTLNQNGTLRHYGGQPRDYQTDVLADKTVGFIRRSTGQPFFVTLATLAPHKEGTKTDRREIHPNPRPAPRHRGRFQDARLPKPPSFNEKDVGDKPSFVRSKPLLSPKGVRALEKTYRARLGSLLAVDDAVGRIVKTLRDEGELSNTLIAFTSDNGYLLGVHRLKAKSFLYEESAQVPFVVRGPGIPKDVHRPQIAGNIDLAPTIFDLTGARPLRVMDGQSLIPLARDRAAAAERDILLENKGSVALRTPRHMYAEHEGGEFELYDLEADPYQLRSRHNDPALADERLTLAQRLAQLRDCAGPTCR